MAASKAQPGQAIADIYAPTSPKLENPRSCLGGLVKCNSLDGQGLASSLAIFPTGSDVVVHRLQRLSSLPVATRVNNSTSDEDRERRVVVVIETTTLGQAGSDVLVAELTPPEGVELAQNGKAGVE